MSDVLARTLRPNPVKYSLGWPRQELGQAKFFPRQVKLESRAANGPFEVSIARGTSPC